MDIGWDVDTDPSGQDAADRPAGAMRLRIETTAYFLRRHRERLADRERMIAEIERPVREDRRARA